MEPENSSGQGLDANLLADRSASRTRSGDLRAAKREASSSEDANFLEEKPSSLDRKSVV